MLIFGFVCIFAGFFLFVNDFSELSGTDSFIKINIGDLLFILAGAVILFIAIVTGENSHKFFLGLYICLAGALHVLLACGIIPHGMKEWWPFFVVLCGISLFLTGLARHRKIKSTYLFPSIIILVIGLIFLLFSLDIIKISFASFVAAWWPLLLILLGTALVVLFLYQKSSFGSFPYMTEDTKDVFGDDVSFADSDEDEPK